MFNQLKNRLGIVDLAGIIRGHIRFEEQQRLAMNDHLAEIKEMMTSHRQADEKKALNDHLDIMTRLGMILSKLEERRDDPQ
jgi:hypothetical protein